MTAESAPYEALNAPPGALERGGTEVLRAAIVEGALEVSLRRGFDDVAVWGVLLADVTRHVARVFALEDSVSETDAVDTIRTMFDSELDRPSDIGSTTAVTRE